MEPEPVSKRLEEDLVQLHENAKVDEYVATLKRGAGKLTEEDKDALVQVDFGISLKELKDILGTL